VFHYDDVATTVTVKPYGGIEGLYAPRRTVLDPLLVDAAREAGADVVFGVSVIDVERAPDGRIVGIVGRDKGGSVVRLRAAITVGADGLHSTIARSVAAGVERRAASASAFIYAHLSELETNGYEWFYGPGVTAGLIPTNDGQTCAWVGAPSSRFRAELATDVRVAFQRLLAETSLVLSSRVAAAAPADRLRSFPGVPGFMRTPWGPGWALVGDAGYFKDPITAHGMSDALRDAELLARAIADVFSGDVPETAALQDYHRTRDRLSQRLFAVTEHLAAYDWTTASIEAHLRSLSAAMVDEVEHLLALDAPEVSRMAG
jgi:2-polyprenyl-6-methoxyphenol hydroxylase-like FAD-dependent oxidoreductase